MVDSAAASFCSISALHTADEIILLEGSEPTLSMSRVIIAIPLENVWGDQVCAAEDIPLELLGKVEKAEWSCPSAIRKQEDCTFCNLSPLHERGLSEPD